MRILVTGCNGQVGHELVSQGKSLNYEMFGFDQDRLDITQNTAVQKILNEYKPDIVINAAAYTAVDKAEQEIKLAYAVNKDGSANLTNACKMLNIPLLHISTDYIFDGKQDRSYREDDPANPAGVYGQSKWEGEQAVRNRLKKHIILRVSWVFGKQGNNFVKTMLRLAKERDELSVVADQYGSPTSATDIAKTLLTLAQKMSKKEEHKSFRWGTYHYSGTPKTTWHDFAKEIFATADTLGLIKAIPNVNAITSAEYPTPAVRPKNSALDCNKIIKTFAIAQPDWRMSLFNVLNEWKKT